VGLKIKNWHDFQHFKPGTRSMVWVKLYRKLLDDPDWHGLDPAHAKGLVNLWLLASESDGYLPDIRKISFRLRLSEKEVKELISSLNHWLINDDDTLISCGYQNDALDKEEEEEEEKPLSGKPDEPEGFVRFWKSWPKTKRKQGRAKCLTIWRRKGLESQADQIIFHVLAMAKTDDWRKGYDPLPETYLNGQRWDGAELDAPESGGKPWFLNGWSSIVAKGAEFKLNESDYLTPPEFRAAVFKAAGITKEIYQKAEADYR
jgi:hypothetical protein